MRCDRVRGIPRPRRYAQEECDDVGNQIVLGDRAERHPEPAAGEIGAVGDDVSCQPCLADASGTREADEARFVERCTEQRDGFLPADEGGAWFGEACLGLRARRSECREVDLGGLDAGIDPEPFGQHRATPFERVHGTRPIPGPDQRLHQQPMTMFLERFGDDDTACCSDGDRVFTEALRGSDDDLGGQVCDRVHAVAVRAKPVRVLPGKDLAPR